MEKQTITYSEIRTWKQCRLKHDLHYRKRLNASGNGAYYSRRGNFVHGYIKRMYREVRFGKETIEQLIAALTDDWNDSCIEFVKWDANRDELKKEFAVIKGMVLGYHQCYFLTERWEGVAAEREVVLDVPDGGRYGIKVDAIVKEAGKYWIHDLKTVSGFNETDKKLLNIDDQFSHYCVVAGLKFQRDFEGGIRTFIKVPGIKQTQKETVDEYCDRVVHDYQSRPEFYMDRIHVHRTQEQLDDYCRYLKLMYREITNYEFVFRSPSQQCGTCDFLNICVEQDGAVRKAMLATSFHVRNRKHSEFSLVAV